MGKKESARPNKTAKSTKPSNHASTAGKKINSSEIEEQYRDCDDTRWKLQQETFNGSVSYKTMGKQELVKGKPVADGIAHFKANPAMYLAMVYQTDMLKNRWPASHCQYTLVHRKGTEGYEATGFSPRGQQTILMHRYQRLPPFEGNVLPMAYRDKYTDHMTHRGRKIHSDKCLPILPGRGMGVCDSPNLKIIGDVDPSDIHQGAVGNCWLLSGISALAEFDGAIKKLFRKTKNLDQRPFDKPNMYTVTLWDLATWKEVDIKIDERLCAAPAGSGQIHLLASKPSEDGGLWDCYVEKALAIHCGGWDKITGGQCTHAWSLMTGCKHQYSIRINPDTGKYACYAKYNPTTKKWARHANSPHDGEQTMWRVAWPKVGGGGGKDKELTADELFDQMYAWDQVNYIVGAGTQGKSDKHRTDGMVDNHAYSVISAHKNVAGTKICLFKVRNPWGNGEIENGEFDDDGPGWDRYPQVKKELKPVVADDGIFYLTKKEFFKHFGTIYLSASNMTEFLED